MMMWSVIIFNDIEKYCVTTDLHFLVVIHNFLCAMCDMLSDNFIIFVRQTTTTMW